MNLNELTAISPVDGRYRRFTQKLAPYFSEFGLIKYRVKVEVEYFIALCKIPLPQLLNVDPKCFEQLRSIASQFSEADARDIKEKEKVTNHDVKAVEYFIKDRFKELELTAYSEFVHFGLTSQDINNTSIPLSLKEALEKEILPKLKEFTNKLDSIAEDWKDIPMLAKTHGQPASPTRLGKEIKVFCERLQVQIRYIEEIPIAAKFGGATGNFNAHHIAYPKIDWVDFSNKFVNDQLGLNRSQFTTQIEHYDQLAALLDAFCRINTILIDFARDIWQYVSMEYFKQKINPNEIGSSAMPHKVNPIDFENAEGNLGIANAIFNHLSSKLPISRLQRDLTDSTVLRNLGVPFAHTLIAYESLLKGISKLTLNKAALDKDLEDNWLVVAEGIQTILRREGIPNSYEILKDFTRRPEKMGEKQMQTFIRELNVPDNIKEELLKLSPSTYTGISLF
ncbi:MAG: adenylosuccinate lyase [Opitutaceae bacterium]|nr:adenylosuccinate lyase [Cytophagales bacterium]